MTRTATVFFDGRSLQPASPLDLRPNTSYVISIREEATAAAEARQGSGAAPDTTEAGTATPSAANLRMLELVRTWQAEPLTPEEDAVLDDFDAFQAQHPLRFNRLD